MAKKKRGRPKKEGPKAADQAPFSVRLSPEARVTLQVLKGITGRTISALVEDGIEHVRAGLSPKDREHLNRVVRQRVLDGSN